MVKPGAAVQIRADRAAWTEYDALPIIRAVRHAAVGHGNRSEGIARSVQINARGVGHGKVPGDRAGRNAGNNVRLAVVGNQRTRTCRINAADRASVFKRDHAEAVGVRRLSDRALAAQFAGRCKNRAIADAARGHTDHPNGNGIAFQIERTAIDGQATAGIPEGG